MVLSLLISLCRASGCDGGPFLQAAPGAFNESWGVYFVVDEVSSLDVPKQGGQLIWLGPVSDSRVQRRAAPSNGN